MKKSRRIIKHILHALAIVLVVPLVLVILVASVGFLGSIGLEQEPLPVDAATVLKRARIGERWMMGIGRLLDSTTRMPADIPELEGYKSENFYPGGTGTGEAWQLGYAQALITPTDWETKTYYEGGNISIPMRTLTKKLDELKVRVIALSDGGGINIFAAVDSIGVTNRQVRQIRALLADMDLQSVNIAATHVHSGVDSTGIYSKGGKADADYQAFVNETTAKTIREAVEAMEPGKLYLSQIGQSMMDEDEFYAEQDKLIGFDYEKDEWDETWDTKWEAQMKTLPAQEYGLTGYINNRRMWQFTTTKLNKLRFAPENPESKETLLLNFAAHPFIAGYKHGGWDAESISGDFIYYMEELINESGANMIYINGAQNGINPQYSSLPSDIWDENGNEIEYEDRTVRLHDWRVRVIGHDFAGLALAMTMPPEEIAANPQINPDNEHGYEYSKVIAMMQNNGTVAERELQPQLDIKLAEVLVELENPVVRWAAKRGSLNMNILRDGKRLTGPTEIGLLELGGEVSIAMLPGEFTPGLAWRGGDTEAAYAIRQRDFAYPTFSESAGREVLVFGLCNDEIGYVIPDNDYLMFYMPGGELTYKLLGVWNYDHYAELLSPGPGAAGAMAEAFAALAGE